MDFNNNEILIKHEPLVHTRAQCTVLKRKEKKEKKKNKWARTVQQQ